jgi:hypothetical protein
VSSIKYFRFRPYFIEVLWKLCGKAIDDGCGNFVENQTTLFAMERSSDALDLGATFVGERR